MFITFFFSFHFSFHFFLIFIFLTIHIPFASSLSRDSRFFLFHLLSFIIPFSLLLPPLLALRCSRAAARVYIHANILLEVRARASGSRSHLFVTGRPVQAGLFQVNARSCATRYLRPFSFSLLPKYELYSLFWAFVSAIATRTSIDNRVSTVWNRAHIFGEQPDLPYPRTIISSFVDCFARNSGIPWLIVTRD